MRDTNALITDSAVAADAFATNALPIHKTPVNGTWLQFKITKQGTDADERLDIKVYGKDTDSSWAVTDDPVGILPQVGSGMSEDGVVIKHLLVQTNHAYVKPFYDVSGTTPSWDVEVAVVSGPSQDVFA